MSSETVNNQRPHGNKYISQIHFTIDCAMEFGIRIHDQLLTAELVVSRNGVSQGLSCFHPNKLNWNATGMKVRQHTSIRQKGLEKSGF